ncbi:MAG: LuxR C-terminal-related transcriptional regulator, partial [Clostridia bacterium]|nr:LuxR C-terminal-related transcriptional regulator [Clostridia bacterium]
FTNNTATNGNGGAIYVQNSILTVDKCNISNNKHIDGSAISIFNSRATIQDSTIYKNTAIDGSIIHVTNSPYHLVSFINNTINGNQSSDNKHFKVDKKEDAEHTLPQEIKTKILLNTFYANGGKPQNILDDEHVSAFANLFVDDESNEITMPSIANDFNAFVDVNTFKNFSADNADSNTQLRLIDAQFALDNAILADEVSFLYNSVYGTFYAGSNSHDKITLYIKTGRRTDAICFDDVQSIKISPKNRFGYDFNAYFNYADLSSALISNDTRNEIIKTSYSLNDEGIGVFVALPIATVFMVIAVVGIIIAVKKKKRLAVNVNKQEEFPVEQEQPQTANSKSWIDIAVSKPIVKEKLSERELDVFVKLLEGKSRKTCAEELFIAESTVKKHSASIYKKFEVKNRAELVNKINNI